MSGKDKGKTGKVLEVLREKARVRIEKSRPVKRHVKKGPSQSNPEGGIIEKNGSVAISNVMVIGQGDKPLRKEKSSASSALRRRRAAEKKAMPAKYAARDQERTTPHRPARAGAGRRQEQHRMAHVCRNGSRRRSRPALMKEFGFKNPMQVPRLEKIVVNMGLGEAIDEQQDPRRRVGAARARSPARSRSSPRRKKSIANFKLREGQCHRRDGHPARRADVRVPRPAGHDRAAPRARLQGRLAARPSTGAATTRWACASRSSSPRSTTTRSTRSKGMNITIVTTARNDEEGRALLAHLGMPFRQ